LVISVTCVTFAYSWWKMDKWPVFAQVRCAHIVASIQKLQMFVKHTSHGNPALRKFCWHTSIYV